jgi:hypothetical protein
VRLVCECSLCYFMGPGGWLEGGVGVVRREGEGRGGREGEVGSEG